jgi:hypothetical protein
MPWSPRSPYLNILSSLLLPSSLYLEPKFILNILFQSYYAAPFTKLLSVFIETNDLFLQDNVVRIATSYNLDLRMVGCSIKCELGRVC